MKRLTIFPMERSLAGRLKNLILSIFIPMVVLIVFVFVLFLVRNYSYETVSGNITLASGFSQDFKNDIDLKMYYYATGSEYATGLPMEEVKNARELAGNLLKRTSDKESLKAITSVISLCDNLEERILQISESDSYDEKLEQLDANVYILTELIQNYMYTYLYNEAGVLAKMQNRMDTILQIEILVGIAVTLLLGAYAILRGIQLSRSITGPIDKMYDRVQTVDAGELMPIEPVQADDEKLQALSNSFEDMIDRLAQQIALNKEEAARIRSMELMLLQAQINPHFLYNTLDTIIWLVETGKNDQAVEMVSSLSNFFRVSLSKGRDVITLAEEQLHVRSYLEIQQVRYKDILTYEIDFAEDIRDYELPKLTLQPIVENALYHGIKLKRGVGSIHISGMRQGEKICLEVKDTGIGMDAETLDRVRSALAAEHAAGFGMAAVYKRLKLMFGDRCDFSIESTEGEGTLVRILLPV